MQFVMAETLDQALELMASGARPIAGGTDLVVGARQGKVPLPDALVAIDRLAGLSSIDVGSGEDGEIVIGACVSHATIAGHGDIVDLVPGLADGSSLIGSPATRHVGTIGGNVMNASPAMDTGAPLLAAGASVVLASTGGSRRVAVADLWTGPSQTTAAPDELCVAVHIPRPGPRTSSAYVRLEFRRTMEIAVVGAGAQATLNEDGSIGAAAVALTAVAPVILAVEAMSEVVGMHPEEAAEVVAGLASEQSIPISDLRASDRYRRHTVGVMASRALLAACRRASGEHISVPLNRAEGIGSSALVAGGNGAGL